MEKRIFLIDGHALIFKMYYAFLRRPMINSKGEDMSILFGFTKYILELIEKEKPTHIIVAFDPPGGTFRNKIYPEYKATRAETPQLVIDALEPLTELCGALHIPVETVPGYEADDVIGTWSKKFEACGFTVDMVTPDKDYGQLISDNIIQYKPGKGGGEREIIDRKAICEKYGISSPAQVIDMLTICGDTSDNVPGVRGVGEVGAGKLIARYGSVDNIYAHIGELSERQQAAFREAEGHIALSRTLVTIRTDVPTDVAPEDALITGEYDPAIAGLFDRYEFSSLSRYISHIEKDHDKSRENEKSGLSFNILTAPELSRKAKETGNCGIAAEYGGDGISSPVVKITVSTSDGEGNYVSEGNCGDFTDILENSGIVKCGYDLKRLINALAVDGITLQGQLQDIELMHYLVNPEKSHKVELLAKSYLGVGIEDGTVKPVQKSLFDDFGEDVPHTGNRFSEAVATCLLSDRIAEDLKRLEAWKLYLEIEEPLVRVLASMERTGVKIDMSRLKKYEESLKTELEERQRKIREMAGDPDLNISSPKQIGILLFEKLKLDPKAKKTGSKSFYSTDEETLAALKDRHPIISEILEFRAVKKLLSTYIEPFPSYVNPRTGRVHTTFNQALTATGRLSSSKPNLQNIPIRTERGKEIRNAFVPGSEDGVILSADYSQIELRIMAHLSGDAHLTEAFRAGLDVHAITASKIFGTALEDVTPQQRRIAKTANFGIMYGISAFGLAQRLGIPRGEAKKIIDDYFANFPAISSYIGNTVENARRLGYVETLFGRRRYLPDINSRNANVKALAERNAVNAPIQGTSADIIKLAMVEVGKEISDRHLKSRMVLQIHDELVFDVTGDEIGVMQKIVTEKMENVISLSVPLTVECNYGKTWLEAH